MNRVRRVSMSGDIMRELLMPSGFRMYSMVSDVPSDAVIVDVYREHGVVDRWEVVLHSEEWDELAEGCEIPPWYPVFRVTAYSSDPSRTP